MDQPILPVGTSAQPDCCLATKREESVSPRLSPNFERYLVKFSGDDFFAPLQNEIFKVDKLIETIDIFKMFHKTAQLFAYSTFLLTLS